MVVTARTTYLTADEARALTDQIKSAAEQLWRLLLEAHERQAWKALGYTSWREYAKTEFGMAQSHAYRLLDQGRVVRALEGAANSPVGEISEREARDIKPKLALVASEIQGRIAAGEPAISAVETVISKSRKPTTYLHSFRRVDRPSRWLEKITLDLTVTFDASDPADGVDLGLLDPDRLPEWIADLRRSAKAITRLANRLEQHIQRRAR